MTTGAAHVFATLNCTFTMQALQCRIQFKIQFKTYFYFTTPSVLFKKLFGQNQRVNLKNFYFGTDLSSSKLGHFSRKVPEFES